MVNIGEYELLSIECEAYQDIELDILKETLKVWKENPCDPYDLVEVRDGRTLAGFCLFYKSPDTEYTFDIHSFVVGSVYRNSAVGSTLLSLLMKKVALLVSCGVLRIETSRNKESTISDKFFLAHGFQLIGHIPDFYQSENDYYIYVKQICADENGVDTGLNPDFSSNDQVARFLSA